MILFRIRTKLCHKRSLKIKFEKEEARKFPDLPKIKP